MIKFLDPDRIYSNRDYLAQWYDQNTLVVTDNDTENVNDCFRKIVATSAARKILDLTHNPVRYWPINLPVDEILTNDIDYYYHPNPRVKFFPLFLWMYSLKQRLWHPQVEFDAGHDKTRNIMCLNNQTKHHRTFLRQQLLPVVDQMVYSIDMQGLPEDIDHSSDYGFNDVGVGHPVYGQCAVNVVTETIVDFAYLSEKACKPFIAHQIPIIVGAAGVTRFLHNVGLDMFEDLVPWTTWDDEPNAEIRIKKIAEFIITWITQGTILADYERVKARVIANKQYFHSEEFRNRIINQMTRS